MLIAYPKNTERPSKHLVDIQRLSSAMIKTDALLKLRLERLSKRGRPMRLTHRTLPEEFRNALHNTVTTYETETARHRALLAHSLAQLTREQVGICAIAHVHEPACAQAEENLKRARQVVENIEAMLKKTQEKLYPLRSII